MSRSSGRLSGRGWRIPIVESCPDCSVGNLFCRQHSRATRTRPNFGWWVQYTVISATKYVYSTTFLSRYLSRGLHHHSHPKNPIRLDFLNTTCCSPSLRDWRLWCNDAKQTHVMDLNLASGPEACSTKTKTGARSCLDNRVGTWVCVGARIKAIWCVFLRPNQHRLNTNHTSHICIFISRKHPKNTFKLPINIFLGPFILFMSFRRTTYNSSSRRNVTLFTCIVHSPWASDSLIFFWNVVIWAKINLCGLKGLTVLSCDPSHPISLEWNRGRRTRRPRRACQYTTKMFNAKLKGKRRKRRNLALPRFQRKIKPPLTRH